MTNDHMNHYVIPPDLKHRLIRICGSIPSLFLGVEIAAHRLYLIRDLKKDRTYRISTSRYGIGNIKESFKTPLGIHCVAEKFGAGAPPMRMFRDRIDTGLDWTSGMPDDNVIVTRILWLKGLEEGINKGGDVDTYERYIYIHGTNKENQIQKPLSLGCILMRNDDIIDLFERVPEGTIIIVYE